MYLLPLLLLATPLSGVIALQAPPLSPGQTYKYENIATPERIAAAHELLAAQKLQYTTSSSSPSSFTAPNITTTTSPAHGSALPLDEPLQPRVYCNGDYGDGKGALRYWDFQYATQMLRTWCDAGGRAAPRTHIYADYGQARVALCNFSPSYDDDGDGVSCSGEELDVAWAGVDGKCPIGRDALSRRGEWLQPDGMKGYARDRCEFGNVCVSVFDVPCSGVGPPWDEDGPGTGA